jgi:hypothetical protein
MLYREKSAVYYEYHMKHTNTMYDKMQRFLMLRALCFKQLKNLL